ncbi:MAG: methyltransferase domain-containing protein [Anaerolineales bacterium]|nr:methyltransferase domain-containing protein [Anaerolineales bacterium]
MDGKTAFGPRVGYYMQARPDYPAAVAACLRDVYGLTETAVIADIGCGTGKLARLFLENGNPVYGVEPDAEMRAASQAYLRDFAQFTAVNGTAEATNLPTAGIDFVVAGQAAHWFERTGAEAEFRRICRPGGKIALVWNQRQRETPIVREFDAILHTFRQPTPHLRRANAVPADVMALAGPQARLHTFLMVQELDFDALVARMLSISFVPLPGEAGHEALLAKLQQFFADFAENGRIRLPYTTELYVGQQPSS